MVAVVVVAVDSFGREVVVCRVPSEGLLIEVAAAAVVL
jgi:hypothetical protein